MPPAWQFSLSWGGASADEEHRVLSRHHGQAARAYEEQPPDRMDQVSPPPKTLPGGGQAGGQHPLHHLPGSDVVAKRDNAKNGHQTWRRHRGQASQRPFRLRDIAEAGPLWPSVLLLIPLKPRDGEHALSSFPLPLASILLAPKPKKSRPPHLGAGHERQRKILQD